MPNFGIGVPGPSGSVISDRFGECSVKCKSGFWWPSWNGDVEPSSCNDDVEPSSCNGDVQPSGSDRSWRCVCVCERRLSQRRFCRFRSSVLNDGESSDEYQMSVFEWVRCDRLYVKWAWPIWWCCERAEVGTTSGVEEIQGKLRTWRSQRSNLITQARSLWRGTRYRRLVFLLCALFHALNVILEQKHHVCDYFFVVYWRLRKKFVVTDSDNALGPHARTGVCSLSTNPKRLSFQAFAWTGLEWNKGSYKSNAGCARCNSIAAEEQLGVYN